MLSRPVFRLAIPGAVRNRRGFLGSGWGTCSNHANYDGISSSEDQLVYCTVNPLKSRYYSKTATDEELEKIMALHRAVVSNNSDVVDKLIKVAGVDAVNKQGWTPLMVAAQLGHANLVDFLLQNGSDAGKVCKTGQDAKEIAMFWNNKECYEMLSSVKSSSVPWQQGNKPFFTHIFLDRASQLRDQPDVLEKLLQKKNTHIIVFHQAKPIVVPVDASKKKRYKLYQTDYGTAKNMLKLNATQMVFLGVKPMHGEGKDMFMYGKEKLPTGTGLNKNLNITDQVLQDLEKSGEVLEHFEAWFAVHLNELSLTIEPTAEVMTSNFHMLTFSPDEAALCAQACTILDWHQHQKFCPSCGSPTQMKTAGYGQKCTNAECISHSINRNSSYPRIDPSMITLLVANDQKHCLLGRQHVFPDNMFSCLAGFIEPGEGLEDAVRREIEEEVGLKVTGVQYMSSQPWPMPSSLMLGMRAYTDKSEDIKIDTTELEDANWFSREDIVEMLTLTHKDGLFVPPLQAIAHQMLRQWVRETAFRDE